MRISLHRSRRSKPETLQSSLSHHERPLRRRCSNRKLDNSRQVWEQPLLPPGKERDDSVALYEFGVPTMENSLHPVTINGYCPVEV